MDAEQRSVTHWMEGTIQKLFQAMVIQPHRIDDAVHGENDE